MIRSCVLPMSGGSTITSHTNLEMTKKYETKTKANTADADDNNNADAFNRKLAL